MKFRFSCGGGNARENRPVTVEMCLEATFGDRVIQAAYASKPGSRILVWREGPSGKWSRSEGISFQGLAHTPENLVRAVGQRDPDAEIYVMPAL